jgi:hypothetical protein
MGLLELLIEIRSFLSTLLEISQLDNKLSISPPEPCVLFKDILHPLLVGERSEPVQVLPEVLVLFLDDVHVA